MGEQPYRPPTESFKRELLRHIANKRVVTYRGIILCGGSTEENMNELRKAVDEQLEAT